MSFSVYNSSGDMSKGKQKTKDPVREERRRAQFAALQRRAAEMPVETTRERIEPVDVTGDEAAYDPMLFAIESGLVEVYDAREGLPVDAEADRALRVVIVRVEGDTERRAGSPDTDAMADAVYRNVQLSLSRDSLLSRAEIVGCLRRVIDSIRNWHVPENPRAYFDFVVDVVRANHAVRRELAEPTDSPIWTPGQSRPSSPERPTGPPRPSGLWLPGDPG